MRLQPLPRTASNRTGKRHRLTGALRQAPLLLGVFALLLSAQSRAAAANGLPPLPSARAANPRRTPIVEAVERVRGAVVNIHSERTVQAPGMSDEALALAPSQNRVNGMGTGILIDPRGYIVTNYHVIEDVTLIRVRLVDGTTLTGRVVARDAEHDLALLKVDAAKPLPTMPLGTASDLMVGETVMAIGNAYGYDHTVTRGIVSAIKRDVTLNKEISYKSLIQTDASINPGNSGGPLININGELVGVNVAIRAGAQGIGFAIPVDTMIQVTGEMLASRRKTPSWVGMVCRNQVNGDADGDSRDDSAATRRSLVIERVEANSPAAKAGLQVGDVLGQLDDTTVCCSLDLERALLERAPGDKLPLVVRRQGAEKRMDLVLQAQEKTAAVPADLVWRKLGLRLSPVNAELVSHTNQQLHGGLAVAEVKADSAAGRAGIQRGDILVGLHSWEMLNLENVVFVLNHPDLATFSPLRFYIVRSGQVHRGWIQQVD